LKNNKKRILFVDHDFGLSGSLISMSYLIKDFVLNDYDVFVLSKVGDFEKKSLISLGAQVISYSSSPFKSITLSLHISDKTRFFSKKWFKNLFKDILFFFNGIILSVKVISKYKPDLIYINEYVSIHFALYAKIKSIPVIVHIRSLFIDQKYNFRVLLLKKALRNIPEYNFTITQLEAEQITNRKNIRAKTIVIEEFLSNNDFIPPENFSQIKKKYGLDNSEKIITFLGGISYIKGSIDFIRSIKHLNLISGKAKFIIAGKIFNNKNITNIYSYYNDCIEYINTPEIKPFIVLLGPIENVKELLAISDIVVSCSVETHFSRPIIEAWAQKKAVVATDIQHSINLIDNGIDGMIVPANNPLLLSKVLNNLLGDNNLCLKLGQNGFLKAKKNFSSEINLKKVINYCSTLVNEN